MERHRGSPLLPDLTDRQLLTLAAAISAAAIIATAASVFYTSLPTLAISITVLAVVMVVYIWAVTRFLARLLLDNIVYITTTYRSDIENEEEDITD